MKYLSLVILIFALSTATYAQQNNLKTTRADSDSVNHVIYLELGGNGGLYSLNYERNIGGMFWVRAGASYGAALFTKSVSIPLSINYLLGKNGQYFEIGLGPTIYYLNSRFSLFSEDSNQDNGFFGVNLVSTIGYRYQPLSRQNIFFKLAFTPAFRLEDKTFVPFGGLSVGYSF